jgi:hypothetical protein
VTLVNAPTPYTAYNKDFDYDYKDVAENSDRTYFFDGSTNIHVGNTKNTDNSTNNYDSDSDSIYDKSRNRSIKRQEQFIRHEQYLRQEQAYNYDSSENGKSSTYGMGAMATCGSASVAGLSNAQYLRLEETNTGSISLELALSALHERLIDISPSLLPLFKNINTEIHSERIRFLEQKVALLNLSSNGTLRSPGHPMNSSKHQVEATNRLSQSAKRLPYTNTSVYNPKIRKRERISNYNSDVDNCNSSLSLVQKQWQS